MVPVSAFFSRLLPQVVGCPEPLAQQALVDAAIAFCDFTTIIAVDLDPVSVVKGVRQYEMDLPSQTGLSQVLRVWLDGKLLGPVPSSEVQAVTAPEGTPLYYYTRDRDEVLNLTLYPTPDKNIPNGLSVRVATRPTRNATQLHSALFDEWVDVIVDSALARLYGTPGQVFSNEAKSVVLMQKARAKTNVARMEAYRGRTVSSLSVQMRSF